MLESAGNVPRVREIEISLDGKPVCLGVQAWTLGAIRSQLETLALSQQRILFGIEVDGVPFNLSTPIADVSRFSKIEGTTIAFTDLGRQMIRVALDQIQLLRNRTEAAALLVMINDWPAARKIWWNLAPDLKEPLLTISFLNELGDGSAKSLDNFQTIRQALVRELGRVQGQIDATCFQSQGLALSEAFERKLIPWLDAFREILEQWHEPSPSEGLGH